MTQIRRRTGVVAALALYWPVLFVLSHIPVPQVVRRAHLSDKSVHLLAYMILTFLLWSAIKPYEKVRWRKVSVWCLLAVVALYGVADECLQRYVAGRSLDPTDFLADVGGALAALGILTFSSFWPASVIVAGAAIYIPAVFTRISLTAVLPTTMTLLHLTTHVLFTLLWIGYVRQSLHPRRNSVLWFATSFSAPVLLVAVTRASVLISGKGMEFGAVFAALVGIGGTIAATALAGTLSGGRRKSAVHTERATAS